MSGIRKATRGAVAAAALVVSFASTASAQERPRDHRHRGDSASAMRFRGGARLFRGVNLSEEQRGKLDEMRNRFRDQAKPLHESAKPDFAAAREARRKGDTASARAAFERTREERDALRALGEKQREEIRNLLTAEQRAVFDSNAAKGRHGGRRGLHGRRPKRS